MTGYGCVEDASLLFVRPSVVEAGVIRLAAKGSRAPSVASRLEELEADLRDLLDRVRPEAVAVEAVFSHYAHPATAVVMAHARGVALLTARRAGVEIVEVAPALVKKAVTGSGRATKQQMQRAVMGMFGLSAMPEPADVADAMAIAAVGGRRLAAARRTAPAPDRRRAGAERALADR